MFHHYIGSFSLSELRVKVTVVFDSNVVPGDGESFQNLLRHNEESIHII